MNYFDLAQAFGGVVVYKTTTPDAASAHIAQSPVDSVLAFVNSDLDFAIANLPDVAYTNFAVKGSALAERARVAMYQKDWTTAVNLTGQIINSGIFSIAPDYKGLFLTATQVGNPEIMFSSKYLAPSDLNGSSTSGIDISLGYFGEVQPYQNLVDEYEMTNGKMITDPTSGYDPANPYNNRDPRLSYTVELPTDSTSATGYHAGSTTLTGYRTKKYVDWSNFPFDYIKSNRQDQNMVHIRYADVLLMYAEAKNELSGPDASIYTALNQIRQRPGVNMPPVNQTLYGSQSTLRDFIYHERRIELALEGSRYYDLKRWGIIADKLSAITNPGGVKLSFGEKNNVLPLPQVDLDKNPNLKQNPGY
jgi:hypothetical protein